MNKLRVLLSGLLIAVVGMMTSCSDDPLKGIVTYTVERPNDLSTQLAGTIKFLDVFDVSVTYKDAAGKLVTENNVLLPFIFKQEVEAPFTATIDVNITLKQLDNPPYEFPRPNGKLTKITVESSGKVLTVGTPAPGTGSGLYSTVNDWLTANGKVSYSLEFTEKTLESNGAAQ